MGEDKKKKTIFYVLISFFVSAIVLLTLFLNWYLRTPKDIIYTTIAPSHWAVVEGVKIHYVEENDDGKQPTLLLVHGFGSSTQTWYKMWPLLAPKYHLIAIDLPGFGLSDKSREPIYNLDFHANILRKFMESQIRQPAYVVSWSMGSLISLWLAKINPELFLKIIAITPALDPDIIFGPYHLLPNIAFLLAPWLITPQYIDLTFHRIFAKQPQGEERRLFIERSYYPFMNNPTAFYSLIHNIPLIKDKRNPMALIGIKTPFRVLAGAKDTVVTLDNYDLIKNAFPNLDFLVNEESGHCLHIEVADWATKQTQDFFKLD
jgi:pimeloyl-ACP methyl ester carboxylesterase